MDIYFNLELKNSFNLELKNIYIKFRIIYKI